MSMSTSNSFHRSPFILFPAGSGTLQPESSKALDLLGQCDAGELYFNRGVASLGLICGGTKGDLDITVGRLVASYLSDPDAQVLILYTDGSIINPEPCPFVAQGKRESVVLVSPRSVESTSAFYTSTGITTIPLRFDEGSVMIQHILSFFTPPLDMDERDSILNTVRLVISQVGDPFDLQRFTELVDKESWTRAGENFMALRQSILRTLLSSQSRAPFPSARQTIVDVRDPVLNFAGIDTVLLDIAFHQWLLQSSGRRLVVFYNSCDRLSSGSPLLRSLESLSALGCDRPTSIILATRSPPILPLHVFNAVDYLVGGLFRSSMWQSALRDHFSINFPSLERASGRQVIWSPESMTYLGSGHEDAREPPYWDDDCIVVAVEEFIRTMPTVAKCQASSPKFRTDSDTSVTTARFGGPAEVNKPALSSYSFQPDEDESMMSSDQVVMNGELFVDSAHGTGVIPVTALETNQVEATGSIPFQELAQEQLSALQISNYPDIFRPLLSGILALRSSEDNGWVSFEDLRKVAGDRDTIKRLGWNSYTSFVNKARDQKLLELRSSGKKAKSVRLLPLKMWEDHIRPLTPSALLLDTCPTGFGGPRPLVEAILQISGGDIKAKVTMEEFTNVFAKTQEELKTFKLNGQIFGHLVKQSCERGWTQQGKFQGHKCIWLGSKLHSLAGALEVAQSRGS